MTGESNVRAGGREELERDWQGDWSVTQGAAEVLWPAERGSGEAFLLSTAT